MGWEVVCEGPRFGEGPVWVDAGEHVGTLVVTSVCDGTLSRVWPETGRIETIADTGGGANGAALAGDGGFVVTQNGGIDFAAIGLFDDPPVARPAAPGLQRVAPDGTVSYLTSGLTDGGGAQGRSTGLQAPNDLVVAADGTVFFTDPPPWPLPTDARGRVVALEPDGTTRLVAAGFFYPNGIALHPDGDLVVVEDGLMGKPHFGLVRLARDGSGTDRYAAVMGDGFCFDVDGRAYVAGGVHGVTVVDRDGSVLDVLEIPGEGLTTNCCFGGPDRRTLFATDALPGRVVAYEGLPTPGLPLHAWPAPPTRPA